MFSHVYLGVTDFPKAHAFYASLMNVLGHTPRFVEPGRPWAGWNSGHDGRPLLLIGAPFDGQPHAPGNGQMVAFQVAQRGQVDEAYRVALKNGGQCEGPPGLRPHYHAHYYGAYFRDGDGNKLCVVCHEPA